MQQSDETLVAEIKRGSQSAMEVLIRRHYKLVYAITYRKTGDYHTACDLTQEVFIKVAKSVVSYHGNGKFTSWLVTIAYHHCADYYRSAQHRHLQEELPVTPETEDKTANVLHLLERKDERTRVKTALLQLPDYQRDSIVLSYYEGMKIREIAEVMECSESAVKSRLHQGLKKLRSLLEGGDQRGQERNHS